MSDVIAQMLAAAGELYDREVSDLIFAAHRTALQGVSDAEVLAAFQAHIADPASGSFFPKPADLLRQVHAARARAFDGEFGRLMNAACYGGASDASVAAKQLFHQATGGADSFDMRRWTFVQWDEVRSRFLAAAQRVPHKPANASIAHIARSQLEDQS